LNPLLHRAFAQVATARKVNFMRKLLTGAAIVLALTGASLSFCTPASAAGLSISIGNDRGHARRESVVSFAFNDVAFGYRDGYWDNGHRWHRWNSDRDYRNYRNHRGSNYRDWNHSRDRDNGWRRH
jgi:hypothetical protein